MKQATVTVFHYFCTQQTKHFIWEPMKQESLLLTKPQFNRINRFNNLIELIDKIQTLQRLKKIILYLLVSLNFHGFVNVQAARKYLAILREVEPGVNL